MTEKRGTVAEERKTAFFKAWAKLCAEHNVEIEVEEISEHWETSAKLSVWFNGDSEAEEETDRDGFEVSLGLGDVFN